MAAQQPSKVIKYGLAIEGIVTAIPAALIFFKPSSMLSFLGASTDVPQSTLDMIQMVGITTAGFAIMCGLASADGPAAVPIRRFTYLCMGVTEFTLCGSMLMMISAKNGPGADLGGVPTKGLWSLFSQIAPIMFWRAYTLTMKPHWFGVNTPHGKTA